MKQHKNKNIVFILGFLFLFFNQLVAKTLPTLLNPSAGKIVDIGHKIKTTPYAASINKVLTEVPAKVKNIDNDIELAKRKHEKYACKIDEVGHTVCPSDMEICTAKELYDPGYSIKHKETIKTDLKMVPATKSQANNNNVFYGDYQVIPNSGSIDGSTITIKAKYGKISSFNNVMITTLMNKGWKTSDGRFAMLMFNYGSGSGGIRSYPAPDEIKFVVNGGSILTRPEHGKIWQIFSHDAKYGTALAIWNTKPDHMRFDCDDYCLISDPNGVAGFGKMGCPSDFKESGDKKYCYKDYYWYEYKCKTDEIATNEDKSWEGPLIDTGSDCLGNCGDFGCSCNSETPPTNNCVAYDFICPFGDQPCAFVDNNNNLISENVINNKIYALGSAKEHKKTLTENKICKYGKLNSKGFCETDPIKKCPEKISEYNKKYDKCLGNYPCNGKLDKNGNCLLKPKAHCDKDFKYNEVTGKCESEPKCNYEGTYNKALEKCETNPICITKEWTYDPSTKLCKKPLETVDPVCSESFLTWNPTTKVCEGYANFNEWTPLNPWNTAHWSLSNGGLTIYQSENTAYPAFYVSSKEYPNVIMSGKIKIKNVGDNDSVGIVFAFKDPTHYFLVNWERNSGGNSGGSYLLSLMKVNGTQPGHHGGTGGTTLAGVNVGWTFDTWYTIRVEYAKNTIHVKVIKDSNKQVIADFKKEGVSLPKQGLLGFFAQSQAGGTYKDFYIATAPTCPNSSYVYVNEIGKCVKKINNANIDIQGNYYLMEPACNLLPGGKFDNVLNKCIYDSICSSATYDTNRGICYKDPVFDCTEYGNNLTLIDSNIFSPFDKACNSENLCPAHSKKIKLGNNYFCDFEAKYSCPNEYVYDPDTKKCVGEAICPKGFVESEKDTSKCIKDYYWYEYTCPAGYIGPEDSGHDCNGLCGDNGCKCNSKNPPANNCYKKISSSDNSFSVYYKKPLVFHNISGSEGFEPNEYGKLKRFSCGSNCKFDVNRIWGDGNKLCFSSMVGDETCFSVDGCYFEGEIKKNDGTVINNLFVKNPYTLSSLNKKKFENSLVNTIRIKSVSGKGFTYDTDNVYSLPDKFTINDFSTQQICHTETTVSHTSATPKTKTDKICPSGTTYDPNFDTCWKRNLYLRVLNRLPDSGGYNHWKSVWGNPNKPTYDEMIQFVHSAIINKEPYICNGSGEVSFSPNEMTYKDAQIIAAYLWYVGRCPDTDGYKSWRNDPNWDISNFKKAANLVTCGNMDYCSAYPNPYPLGEETNFVYSTNVTGYSCPTGYSLEYNNGIATCTKTETKQICNTIPKWRKEGFSLTDHALLLSDGNWYIKKTPIDNSRNAYDSTVLSKFKFLPDSAYKVLTYSNVCYVNGKKVNDCASDIQITLPKNLSLVAISDIESVSKKPSLYQNNAFDEDFFVSPLKDSTKEIEVKRHEILAAKKMLTIPCELYLLDNNQVFCLNSNEGIVSNCKMNGHVGWSDLSEGISSIKAGAGTYNFVSLVANGKADFDVQATKAGTNNVSKGFNIGLMAFKLSDGNWYTLDKVLDDKGEEVSRPIPSFVKLLPKNYFMDNSTVIFKTDEKGDLSLDLSSVSQCYYKGHKLAPGTCLNSLRFIIPEPDLKVVAISDLESLASLTEPDYETGKKIPVYENNQFDLNITFDQGQVIYYKGKGKMDPIKIEDSATKEASTDLYYGNGIWKKDTEYINTINEKTATVSKDLLNKEIKDRLYFWDSYLYGYLGYIEFVREVAEKDRLENFMPENEIPYYMYSKNFYSSLAIPSKNISFFVEKIDTNLSEKECNAIAQEVFGQVITEQDIMSQKIQVEENFDSNIQFFKVLGAINNDNSDKFPCVIKLNGLQTFHFVNYAMRKETYSGQGVYKCSPYVCDSNYQCEIAKCPVLNGYNGNQIEFFGNVLPKYFNEEINSGACIEDICDVNAGDYIDYCGRKIGCDITQPGIFKDSKGNCKQYYCPKGELDPSTNNCKILECPIGTIEDPNNPNQCIKK